MKLKLTDLQDLMVRTLSSKYYTPEWKKETVSTYTYLDAELATNNQADFVKIPDLKFFDQKKLI